VHSGDLIPECHQLNNDTGIYGRSLVWPLHTHHKKHRQHKATTSNMALNYVLKFGSLFALATGTSDVFLGSKMVEGPSNNPFPITTASQVFADSQIRFLGATWAAFGAMLWWVSDDLVERRTPLAILNIFFALGGVGRVIGGIKHGFKPGMVLWFTIIELVAPALVWLAL
jgi:hypothetical protein